MNKLAVLVNDELVYEPDTAFVFDEQKVAFFDRMDADMERGIRVHGKLLVSPDARQRATFVVMNLIKALQQENEAVISASCAYLVHRFPALTEVHANDNGDTVNVELIEE